MDNVTRGLRELMKPIANRLPSEVYDDVSKIGKLLGEPAQAFARRYLSETAK